VAESVQGDLGGASILVNSAFSDGNKKTFEDSDLDEWRHTMDVNFWGTLTMTKAMLPQLTSHDDSRLIMVNTQSTLWIKPRAGAYASSKGALATVTRTLARELGGKGVRVNGVHPGYIFSPTVEAYLQAETCLGYLPPAAEVAGTIVYLASPLAACVTGQAIAVNGGHWI
jgi:NAD(P)-dependent dehydrogenase (short-subunit alcohol dehydrogenase family)